MKLAIGIILYEDFTAKYLPYFLESLQQQTFKDFELLVFDNSEKESEKNLITLQSYYPDIKPQGVKKNLGFARAYNFLIDEAIDKKCEYFLAINPDVILEPEAIIRMIARLDNHENLGSVSAKLRYWDFKNNQKTNIIDSCGIKMLSGLRFVEVGQNQEDKGQFDNEEIIGPSGAIAMFRLSALEKIKKDSQYYDELMFMYKEDCDLAYRLNLAGFKSKCVADAVGYHNRTAAGKGDDNITVALNRKNKSWQVKKWSFLHQQIIYYKYWQHQSWQDKLAIIWFELKMLIFILLFEQYLLGQIKEFWRIRKNISVY